MSFLPFGLEDLEGKGEMGRVHLWKGWKKRIRPWADVSQPAPPLPQDLCCLAECCWTA